MCCRNPKEDHCQSWDVITVFVCSGMSDSITNLRLCFQLLCLGYNAEVMASSDCRTCFLDYVYELHISNMQKKQCTVSVL